MPTSQARAKGLLSYNIDARRLSSYLLTIPLIDCNFDSMPDLIDPPTIKPTTGPRSRTVDPKTRELVKSLYLQGLQPPAIALETGLNKLTIGMWAQRYGWSKLKSKTRTVLITRASQTLVREAANGMQSESNKVREMLAKSVSVQAESLAKLSSVSVKQLGNTPDGQGLASIAKTIAETASTVFDWSSSHSPGVVVVGLTEQFDEDAPIDTPAIDVTSESQELSGPDTTIGSVPQP